MGRKEQVSSILIGIEGNILKTYFNALLQDKKIHGKVIVSLDSKPENLISSLTDYQKSHPIENYTQKWIVLDNEKYSKTELQKLNHSAKKSNICIAISNYSLELWILLHFQPILEVITSTEITTLLENIFKEKLGINYHDVSKDIYPFIVGFQAKAIQHAKLLAQKKEIDLSLDYPVTTIHELVECLNFLGENKQEKCNCSIGSLAVKTEVRRQEVIRPSIPLTQQNIISFFLEKIQKKEELKSSTHELATTLDMATSTVRTHIRKLKEDMRLKQVSEGSATKYKLIEPYVCMFDKYFIYINQQLIGYLGFTKGMYQFAYTNQYLLDTFSEKISTDFNLTTEVYYQAKIFPFFEGQLPEGVDRTILEKKCGTATHFYLFEYLHFDTMDIIMSKIELKFEEQNRSNYLPYSEAKLKILGETQPFPNLIDYPINIDNKKLFPPENLTNHEIKALNIKPMSLSGFQHKFKIMIDNDKEEIRELDNNEDALYFMKPYNEKKADPSNENYFPHLAINEHLFMSFAKNELGFDVPTSAICKNEQDAEYHYVIKYFNRYKGYRYFMDEVSTLMGLDSEDKYNTTAEKMFKEIVKVVKKEEEKLKLLNYFFYSMIISHEDMHTKNLSIMLDREEYYASPLYDIATTKIYSNSYGYDSHLTVNGKQTNIRLNDFLKLADILELDKEMVKENFASILFQFTYQLEEYIIKLKQLGNLPFYIKTKETASGQKSKIKKETNLVDILLNYHQKRVKELIKLQYFSQLNISPPQQFTHS